MLVRSSKAFHVPVNDQFVGRSKGLFQRIRHESGCQLEFDPAKSLVAIHGYQFQIKRALARLQASLPKDAAELAEAEGQDAEDLIKRLQDSLTKLSNEGK